MSQVLVVEDEKDIRDLIVLHLSREGFRCRSASNGVDALAEVRSAQPDLVVLDLMLPGLGGLEVCRRLRGEPATASLPIIMLTAKADGVDRVVGLELGADDYVVKPFSPKELVARVRAVLRRSRSGGAADVPVLRAGALTLDPSRHRVTIDERPLTLTPKEFDLLQALLESSGRVLSREQLLSRVWGFAHAEEIESRTVDVHVRPSSPSLALSRRTWTKAAASPPSPASATGWNDPPASPPDRGQAHADPAWLRGRHRARRRALSEPRAGATGRGIAGVPASDRRRAAPRRDPIAARHRDVAGSAPRLHRAGLASHPLTGDADHDRRPGRRRFGDSRRRPLA